MKKLVAIFLLLQIISNNTFAVELIKIPKLFTHYQHHSKEHKDTKDFLDFLHKHYSDHHDNDKHDNNHNEEDEDCNLPFKHCNGCCVSVHSSVIAFIPNHIIAEFIPLQIKSVSFKSENDKIESLSICTIWQPPKTA